MLAQELFARLRWRALLPSSLELFDLAHDPFEQHDLAAKHPDQVAALQERIQALARASQKPLFFVDQLGVIQRNMQGEPILPSDDEQAGIEVP